MTDKESKMQRLSNWLNGKKSADNTDAIEETLPGFSLKVMADKKLLDRLDEWEKTWELINEPIEAETLYDFVSADIENIQLVHRGVQRVAGVYATAGDREGASDGKHLMHGWSVLANNFIAGAINTRRWWGNNEPVTDARNGRQSINAINVFNHHASIHKILYKKADMVVAFCFKRIDVTPRHVTTIQTMMPMMPGMGGGETLTSSAGRTSEDQMRHPQGGPYKPRISNKVE